ncbi:hypothetical protein AB1N83_013557 [Pleurotus pulmonarius]
MRKVVQEAEEAAAMISLNERVNLTMTNGHRTQKRLSDFGCETCWRAGMQASHFTASTPKHDGAGFASQVADAYISMSQQKIYT